MMSCCVVLLAGCEIPAGDFCDIAKPDLYADEDVVDFMTLNDPEHVRQDLAENEYGKANCPPAWISQSAGGP